MTGKQKTPQGSEIPADPAFDAIWQTVSRQNLPAASDQTITLYAGMQRADGAGTPEATLNERPGFSVGPATIDVDVLPSISLSDTSAEARADLDVIAMLGTGGMGLVKLAKQHSLWREVAVKVLRPDKRTEHGVQALLQEALFSGYLEHPNIIPVHQLGRTEDGDVMA